ncbi:MAG: Gfo/Idh/MocA family protein [Alphaproteobacteria bacterium]
MTRLRTVIVGFGAIARGLERDARMARYFRYATHAQALAAHPAFAWTAVVDPDPAARAAVAVWPGVRACASLAELPDAASYEVAVLSGPPDSRIDAARSLPGLKAVMAEKPLGADFAAAGTLVELCRTRGVALQVNLWRRGDATMRALAAGGREARIGRLQAGTALYGNGLRNNGTHLVDLLRMLCGEVRTVRAAGPATVLGGTPLAGDVALSAEIVMAGGGQVALLPLDFAQYREVGLDLWGERGRLSILHEGLLVQHYPRRANRAVDGTDEIACDSPETLPAGASDALYALYDNLAAHLATGAAMASSGASALASEAVIDALLRSSRGAGCVVALDERRAA